MNGDIDQVCDTAVMPRFLQETYDAEAICRQEHAGQSGDSDVRVASTGFLGSFMKGFDNLPGADTTSARCMQREVDHRSTSEVRTAGMALIGGRLPDAPDAIDECLVGMKLTHAEIEKYLRIPEAGGP